MFSNSEENYIKAIFHVQQHSKSWVPTNAIAKKLETKASSVTDMIQKLSDKEVLQYQKYKGVQLTAEGKKKAASIIRKHRLWEVFLVEKLNFSWDEVHEVAEQLEHIASPKMINELDAFLGYPKIDPHGDPIPDEEGNISMSHRVLLSSLKEGTSGICVGVKDSSASFLQFLDKNNIALGDTITVIHKEEFDQSMTVSIGAQQLQLSYKITQNIYIENHELI